MTGQTLSHYRIIDYLGKGGMGVVYLAVDTHLERQVAIKVLASEAVTNPERKRRFAFEARAASALNHPNIITIYDIDATDGIDFIAMELVQGKSLDRVLGKRLPLLTALDYSIQIASALGAAHAANIVHRDLKPANIMVNQAGLVKVLDFGLAKLTHTIPLDKDESTESMDRETDGGRVMGTPSYMSPEQASGDKVDHRSDIFSYGSVLYEMLTGRRPFSGPSKSAVLDAICTQDPQPIHELVKDVPHDLERVVTVCLEKDAGRRFQNIEDIRIFLERTKKDLEAGGGVAAGRVQAHARRRWVVPLVVAGLLVVAAVGAFVWSWPWAGASRTVPTFALTRLTSDMGLSQDPTVSPDGKMLAYSSDRSGAGNLDIWVQQLAGGDPLRVTTNPADDTDPSFSNDGTKVAFHSTRAGGGIYVVSTFGGTERLIVSPGLNPKYSPDGTRILYWVGEEADTGPPGKIYAVPSSGTSPPRQLVPSFADARYPLWTSDGHHVMFQGRRQTGSEEGGDWWVTALDEVNVGIFPIKTEAMPVFRKLGYSPFLGAGGWAGDKVVFAALAGDTISVFRATIAAPSWKLTGVPERITQGTGAEAEPFPTSDGRLVLASFGYQVNVWQLPLTHGMVSGKPQQVTQGASYHAVPSVSRDGSKLVFLSGRAGSRNVRFKDLKTGSETDITVAPEDDSSPVVAPDGTKVAYAAAGGATRPIRVALLPPASVTPRSVCDDCGEPSDWSPDGNTLLFITKSGSLGALAVASGAKTEIIKRNPLRIDSARFSPDGGWLAVAVQPPDFPKRIYVMPFRRDGAVPEDRWIAVTNGRWLADRPAWSREGDAIYFYSTRDGFGCIWKQSLDFTTREPVGTAAEVYSFHSSVLSMSHMPLTQLGVSAAKDKLILNLVELRGSIWMRQSDSPRK